MRSYLLPCCTDLSCSRRAAHHSLAAVSVAASLIRLPASLLMAAASAVPGQRRQRVLHCPPGPAIAGGCSGLLHLQGVAQSHDLTLQV